MNKMVSKYTFIFVLLLSLNCLVTAQEQINNEYDEDYWNILSFDGGGIRGLIPSTIVDYMEKYSYNYSRETYCLPER